MNTELPDEVSRKQIVLATGLIVLSLLIVDLHEPGNMVDRVEEQDRTTNLMAGSMFKVHFESGGTQEYEYTTYRDTYCETHPNSSNCPPENTPTQPPLMQKFNFTKHPTHDTVYTPKNGVCLEETYQKCSGKSRLEPLIEGLTYSILKTINSDNTYLETANAFSLN